MLPAEEEDGATLEARFFAGEPSVLVPPALFILLTKDSRTNPNFATLPFRSSAVVKILKNINPTSAVRAPRPIRRYARSSGGPGPLDENDTS